MGGRGASSGISKKENPYGSQYRTIIETGNIKFVEAKTEKQPETLLESMTPGRIYVLVNRDNGNLKSILYMGDNGLRAKRVDLDHYHEKEKPHAHDGFLEGVFRPKLTRSESEMIDDVFSVWQDYKRKP